jgi:predicted heme/steroid binding protein
MFRTTLLVSALFLSAVIFNIFADSTTAKTDTLLPAKQKNSKSEAAHADTFKATPLTLTLAELSKFNGQNGAKAYVAAFGIIYDVTDVKAWKGGKHKGHEAGQDVSILIKKSPHGKSVLKKLRAIGKLVLPVPETIIVK